MKTLKFAVLALALSGLSGTVAAKLPPLSDEAKAAAAAAKDKAAYSDKVAAYKLCQSQNKTASHYFKTKNAQGKPAVETPACTDPGPFVAAQTAAATVGVADAKPVPAAGKAPTPAAASK